MTPLAEAYPLPDGYIDRRTFAGQVHAKQHVRPRLWTTTTGICLHQTACDMGERVERYDNTGAHIIVLRSGRWIQLHELYSIVAHGNGWNTQTVGIEINGLFAGEVGGHVWDDPSTKIHETAMTPTPIQLVRTVEICRWIHSEVQRRSGRIRALVAHRQASEDRRDDPGEEVWKAVALPLHRELGWTDGGVGFTLGGLAIPESWDPRCEGIKY